MANKYSADYYSSVPSFMAAPSPAASPAPASIPLSQMISAPVAPASVAPSTPATAAPASSGNWNQDTATELGRAFGLLSGNEIAANGLLKGRLTSADPATQSKFNQIQNMLMNGNSEDDILNALVDHQITQTQQSPQFGSLAKAPYKEFKPFSMEDYQADPGYQFRLDEGNKALERAQAARGNFYSGAALKEASKYNSDQASQEYGNAYNRYNTNFGIGYNQAKGDSDTLYNRLAGIANTGMGATNTAVNNNNNNANQLGTIYGQVGNVNAAASLNEGSNINSLVNKILGQNNIGNSSYTLPWQTKGNVNPSGGYY